MFSGIDIAADLSGFRCCLQQLMRGICISLAIMVRETKIQVFTQKIEKIGQNQCFYVLTLNSLADKWTLNDGDAQSNGLVATYSFTSPIISVCVTDYVIHALTDHGIETYTHCIGHKLFNNVYEYNLSDDLYTSEVCQSDSMPIASKLINSM